MTLAELFAKPVSELSIDATVFKGSVCEDQSDWTLDQAANADAYSRQCSASNGVWVSWGPNADCQAKLAYEMLVAKIMREERHNFAV